jgi:hypothetical protein
LDGGDGRFVAAFDGFGDTAFEAAGEPDFWGFFGML